nr:sarcosine oxidase subunit gamma [Pseudogemmobacter hezensis]
MIAKSPLEGQAPLTRAGLTLSMVAPRSIWSLALYPGADPGPALGLPGLRFPAPGESVTEGDVSLIWTGREQAFLLGMAPPAGLSAQVAVTDQSGAWAGLRLAGRGEEGAEAALSRLVPLDLRLRAFPLGRVARTALNHINAIVWRRDEAGFTLFVPRSMAFSAWHEIAVVLDRLAARESGRGRG